MSLLQTLGCYLVCLVGTDLYKVGILESTAAEDDEQGKEGCQRNQQTGPVAEASVEHIVNVVEFRLAQFQRMNVFIFIAEIGCFIA